MIKRMICIECPKSCVLAVDVENSKVVKVEGAKCPKGVGYAMTEVEDPVRILTATVLTDKPIPKKDILRAMREIKGMRITSPLRSGDILVDDFLGLGVRLVATREAT
jgi:CxxC motif-containing protein